MNLSPYGPKTHKTFLLEDKKTRTKGKCSASRCSKRCRSKDRYCPRCQARRYKVCFPARYAYFKLRWSAIYRNIKFTLSIREWEMFWEKHELGTTYGRSKTSLTVDRIRNQEGYHFDNIQVLTLQENGRKGQIEGLDRRCQQEYDIHQ